MRQKVTNGHASSPNPAITLPPPVERTSSAEEIAERLQQAASRSLPHTPALNGVETAERLDGIQYTTEELHWGEEKISVSKFNICTIGPFVRTVNVPCENRAAALRAEYEDLVKFAEEMRTRKLRSMAQSIIETHRTLREAGAKLDGDS